MVPHLGIVTGLVRRHMCDSHTKGGTFCRSPRFDEVLS
jgi:hypothetical protein